MRVQRIGARNSQASVSNLEPQHASSHRGLHSRPDPLDRLRRGQPVSLAVAIPQPVAERQWVRIGQPFTQSLAEWFGIWQRVAEPQPFGSRPDARADGAGLHGAVRSAAPGALRRLLP